MRAVRVEEYGGPDAMVVRDVEAPQPGPGEVVVDVAAAGVNFIDVYHRTGHYPNGLPFTLGSEGAGTVAAVGEGVTDVRPGDRVAWSGPLGSYAEQALVPAGAVVPVPDGLDLEVAAAALLQGMTAQYLVRSTYRVGNGDAVLVHAAAGGVGLLLTQLVSHLGGRVLATVSTPTKAKLAREAGAEVVVEYDALPDAAKQFTGGKGVDVAYDGVGAATFEATLASLRRRGTFVSYGSASGPVPPVDPLRLSGAGSLFFTRPRLADHVAERAELLERAQEVLGWIADGTLHVRISARYPLDNAGAAHEALEGRRTTGKVLLVP
jgi:NADPH2:quinone reductase